MKKGTRIRFKVVNYTAGHVRVEETDQVEEGTIITREVGGFVVRVEGYELPYYVTPDDIIKESDGKEA